MHAETDPTRTNLLDLRSFVRGNANVVCRRHELFKARLPSSLRLGVQRAILHSRGILSKEGMQCKSVRTRQQNEVSSKSLWNSSQPVLPSKKTRTGGVSISRWPTSTTTRREHRISLLAAFGNRAIFRYGIRLDPGVKLLVVM